MAEVLGAVAACLLILSLIPLVESCGVVVGVIVWLLGIWAIVTASRRFIRYVGDEGEIWDAEQRARTGHDWPPHHS